MSPQELSTKYPKLFHMAELGSWPSIQKHGLLSANALLDLFEVVGPERVGLESEWRPNSCQIRHPDHGTALLRDQKPMPPDELSKCLDGISTQEWYRLINGKTFFWAERRRLNNLLNAIAYRNRPHCVITIDTQALLDRHESRTSLSAINSGFTYHGGTRGRDTFKSIAEFPGSNTVWELAVEYSVPDLADCVIRVEDWEKNSRIRVVWENQC